MHLDTNLEICIQMNRVYSKTFQQGSQTSFSPGSLFSPHYLALFGYMIHFFQPNFSLSNLFLFFFPSNHKNVILLHWTILRCFRGWGNQPSSWFQAGYFLLPSLQIKKLPKSRTSANCLHWPIRNGCLLNKNSERLMAAGNALIEKDSNNHTTQA